MRTAFSFLAALALASTALAGGKPLPPSKALDAAKRLVAETYKKELSAADKAPAVKAMLELAAQTEGDDPAQAALYLGAAEVAARAGETKLAFDAVDQLAAVFDVDTLQSKVTLLEISAKAAKTNDARVSVANRGLELADAAMAANRMEIAESALKTAGTAAAKVRDADLRKELAAKRKEVERAKKHAERAESELASAKKALSDNPDDPEANETLGKYLAFERNDWAAGLKHFAKSGDQSLQALALADMKGATTGAAAATLGDSWYAFAESADNPSDKAGYRSRAAFWYTRAVNDLKGFAKARIEKRLGEMQDALAAAANQTGGENGKFIDVTLAPGVLMRLVKIPASADGKIPSFYLGQTEVTQKQWQAVMGSNPSGIKGDNLPVGVVTWEDCNNFAQRLNSTPNGKRVAFRLPTQAELSHAYLAGQTHEYYLSRYQEFFWTGDNSGGLLKPVGTKKANTWGIHDSLGNAWEWCNDETIWGGSVGQKIAEHKNTPRKGKTDNPSDNIIGLRVAAEAR